jgi:hypothetical protein
MNRKLSAFLIATAIFGGSASTASSGEPTDSANYTIGITGFVPVICRASVDETIVRGAAGKTSLGNLNEFCNSPNGYQVFVEGSPELANATIVVDGNRVPLAATGPTLISSSNGPSIVSHRLVLQTPSGNAGGSLSIRVVAL